MSDYAARLKAIQDQRDALQADDRAKEEAIDAEETALIAEMQAAAQPTQPTPAPAPPVASPPPAGTNAPPPAPVPVLAPSGAVPRAANLTPETYGDFVCMHPGYLPKHIPEATLAALTTIEPVGSAGEMTNDEPGTGYRPELGERALGAQLWAITMDPRARVHMLAEADLAKLSFPIHVGIQGVDGVPKPWKWSIEHYASLYDGAPLVRTADTLAATSPIHVDDAHFPQFLFDAACLMGIEGNAAKFAEYVEQMKWCVSRVAFNAMCGTPQYCQGTKYILNSLAGQQRANAWDFRDVDDLLFVLEHFSPQDDWIPWLTQCVEENVRFNDGVFRTGDYDTWGSDNPYTGTPGTWTPYGRFVKGGYANPWGITRGMDVYDPTDPCIALWQQGFQSAVLTRSYLRNHPSLSAAAKSVHAQLVGWLGNLWKLVLGAPNDPTTFDYRHSVVYSEFKTGKLKVPGDSSQGMNFFKTPAEFYAPFAAYGALGPDDHQLRNHGDNSIASLAGGFLDNCIPAIYAAVDAGVNLSAELGRLESTPQWQAGGDTAFCWLSKGKKYPVDGAAPIQTPAPAPTPPAPVPAPAPAPSQQTNVPPQGAVAVAGDGDTISATTDATGLWGVHLDAPHSDLPGAPLVSAGNHFIPWSMKAGEKKAVSSLGNDPAYGVIKGVYILTGTVQKASAVQPPAPTPAPAPGPAPAPTPVTYDATTEIIPDDGGVRPLTKGGFLMQPVPADYVHTRAHPPGVRPIPSGPTVALPAGTGWREIPGTKMQDIESPIVAGGDQNSGPNAVMSNWTGGAWIEALQLFVQPPGGGHFGNDNSTFYGFNADVMKWVEFFPPLPLKLDAVTGAGPVDHAPGPEYVQASHFYGSASPYLDKRDGKWKLMLVEFVGVVPFLFDPATGTIERGPAYQPHNEIWIEQQTGMMSIYDEKGGLYLFHTTAQVNQLSHYEPEIQRWVDHGDRKAWGVYGGSSGIYYSYNSVLGINPDKDQLVSVGIDGILVADLAKVRTNGVLCDVLPILPASAVAQLSGSHSVAWDDEYHDFVIHDKELLADGSHSTTSGILWRMDPSTFALSLIVRGGPAPNQNGNFGRFFKNKKRGEFMVCSNVADNFWAYKRTSK